MRVGFEKGKKDEKDETDSMHVLRDAHAAGV